MLARILAFPLLEAVARNESGRLMLIGAAVGILGGLAAGAFDWVSVEASGLLLGSADPSVNPVGAWNKLLAPAGVALLSAFALWYGSSTRYPQGIPDVMDALANLHGQLRTRDGILSGLSAALNIGAGLSGGREGPIVQLSSTLAARLCTLLRLPPRRMRVLVAAGAAGGIAASFNTPVGGAFFALEILLGNFALESVAPVVAASVTGTMVGQALLGQRIALELPPFGLQSPWELLIYPFLGILCGAVGIAHKLTLLRTLDLRDAILKRWPIPPPVFSGLAGLLVGLLALVGFHQIMGNGYAFLERMLRGEHPGVLFLIVLLVVKTVATAITQATRTGLGIFAPTLFLGALTGTLFGLAVNGLWPGLVEAPGAYGMVGMGGTMAAVAHAPITMTLMLFEMTGNYAVVPPMLLTLVVSGLIYRAVDPRSLYVAKLERRGGSIDRGREELIMYDLRVSDVMRKDGMETVAPDAPFCELASRILHHRVHDVYVVDGQGRYHGMVDIQDIKRLLSEPHDDLRASDVEMQNAPTLRPELSLAEAVPIFFRSDLDELPVVGEDGALIAILKERDIFGAFHREVLRKDALMARIQTSPEDQHRWKNFLELPEGYIMDVVEVDGQLVGHTLRDLRLPVRFHVTVVAVSVMDPQTGRHRRRPAEVDLMLHRGDKLVVMGPVVDVLALQAAHVDHEVTEMADRVADEIE
ncbi:MAG: chloride channel protein [Pseudomonadota bacterium]